MRNVQIHYGNGSWKNSVKVQQIIAQFSELLKKK